MDLFLGLDIGTSGVKAILMSASGDVETSASTPLTLDTPRPGWAEQDPGAWWQATLESIRKVLADRPAARVAAIGISGQMHSSVFLDRDGRVIRPALLWCDGRTTAECEEITARAGGEAQLREWACNPALEGFTLPKVLWLRNHEPAAFARLATVLLAKDFIRFRLTGALATEPSDASATLMFDTANGRWSREILDAVELPASLLPDVGGSAEILGYVTPDAAALTGLAAGTAVVGGGADNACGAAGVGAIEEGDAVASWGTSGTVLAPTATPRVDPELRAHTFCHVVPGTWYLMGVVLSAGGAFSWYRDQIARQIAGREERVSPSPGASDGEATSDSARQNRDHADLLLNDEAATVPPGADGVTFLPYLQGERTPHRDAAARAAFLGLSLAHTRAHLTRAVLEGICFALRDSVSILAEIGLVPGQMFLTGGGAKSPFLRQLQADIFGLPVRTVNREEGPAYGAALLAAVGAGTFPDLAAAANATLIRSQLEHPNPGAHAAYQQPYERFRNAYAGATGRIAPALATAASR
ncbi:MAG: xylulokinase [Longimicrobiales bacterium]